MTARENLMHVYAKIDALKDEYMRLFKKIYGRNASWIYMQSFGVEEMKGLVRGLKLKENSK
jgi:hypothetical protein